MATNRDAFASLRYFAVCYVICRCSQLPSNASITTLRSQKSSTYMEVFGWTMGWTACSHLSDQVSEICGVCRYARYMLFLVLGNQRFRLQLNQMQMQTDERENMICSQSASRCLQKSSIYAACFNWVHESLSK